MTFRLSMLSNKSFGKKQQRKYFCQIWHGMLSYLAINTDAASKHGNDADTMLPDHLPEVTDSV